MRWGFGMKQGPFELWQEAGWLQVANWVKEDIDAGKALCKAPLPDWVFDGPVAHGAVHTPMGSWSAARQTYAPRSDLPVYQRQYFAESVINGGSVEPLKAGTELFKNDEMRLWTLDGEVLIASITCKLHLIGTGVVEGLAKAVELAEASATRVW
jgi:3-hydroxyacyl-CoA dehydrogenase